MKKLILAALLLSLSACAFAQKDYVSRYDVYSGFSYLDTPIMNLTERGYIAEAGINLTRWLTFGADFSVMTGHSTLFVKDLTPELRGVANSLGVPDSFGVPYNSTTYTYTVGPQINIRKTGIKKVTLFVHPDIGVIHEKVTADPKTPAQIQVTSVLVPKGYDTDTTYFYGIGGGAEYALTRRIGLRFTADFVHMYLFSDFLGESRNALRVSVGPSFKFGKNVANNKLFKSKK